LALAVQSHLGIEELGSIRDSRKTQSLELHFRALLTEGSAKVLVHRGASDSIGGVLDERSTMARIDPNVSAKELNMMVASWLAPSE
jgi:hypothetical protein